jgi:hypothetical protein
VRAGATFIDGKLQERSDESIETKENKGSVRPCLIDNCDPQLLGDQQDYRSKEGGLGAAAGIALLHTQY